MLETEDKIARYKLVFHLAEQGDPEVLAVSIEENLQHAAERIPAQIRKAARDRRDIHRGGRPIFLELHRRRYLPHQAEHRLASRWVGPMRRVPGRPPALPWMLDCQPTAFRQSFSTRNTLALLIPSFTAISLGFTPWPRLL